jgi:hypothetical protein
MENITYIVAIVVLIIILVVLFGPCSTAPPVPASSSGSASSGSASSGSVSSIGNAVAAATGLTTAVSVANAVSGNVAATTPAATTPAATPAATTKSVNLADGTERMYVFRAPRKPTNERLALPSPAAVAGTVGKIGQGVRNVVKGRGAFGSSQPVKSVSSTPTMSMFDQYERMATVKNTKKHHGAENFVDGLGRQQSFMYYRVGNPGAMGMTVPKTSVGTGPLARGSVPSAGPKIERFAMPGSLSDMLSDTQDAVGQAWSGLSAPFQR